MNNDIRNYINIINEASNSMDEKDGLHWERDLMRTWASKAAAHMAKVVKNSFNSLYPNVPIRVKRQDIFVMASTDPNADFSDELDIDVLVS